MRHLSNKEAITYLWLIGYKITKDITKAVVNRSALRLDRCGVDGDIIKDILA